MLNFFQINKSLHETTNEDDQSFSNYSNQSMSISEDGMLVSEDLSETSYYNENILEDILDDNILEESEAEVNADYPNEAYADLMTLVTKHNISNKTGDAIIKFFNKHANLNTSPLLKSIMQGRNYMDNMNIPSLTF